MEDRFDSYIFIKHIYSYFSRFLTSLALKQLFIILFVENIFLSLWIYLVLFL